MKKGREHILIKKQITLGDSIWTPWVADGLAAVSLFQGPASIPDGCWDTLSGFVRIGSDTGGGATSADRILDHR